MERDYKSGSKQTPTRVSEEIEVESDTEVASKDITQSSTVEKELEESEEQPVEVSIKVERDALDKAVARVSVRDWGFGVLPSEQERIWERFYRASNVEVRSGSRSGLGLGLHICRSFIERHGGHVGMQSIVGEGSLFWFTLPLLDGTDQ